LVTTVLALGGVAAWWYLNQAASTQPPVQATQLAISAKPQPQPIAPPVSPSAALVTNSLTVAPPPVVPAPVSVAALPVVVSRPESTKLSVPASVPATKPDADHANFSLKMDNLLQHAPSPAVATRPAAGTPRTASVPILSPSAPSEPLQVPTAASKVIASSTLTAPQSQARSPAAQEALAQAQQLWNAGSHSAAIDLLHEALTLAERANLAGAPSGSMSVIASIARELARMELAEGRVSQVLVLLTRLEPLLSDVADIWAIRGNAAQRLGQHPESAAAYLMALKLRPNEPRWMLGAAVSLAAQGQTTAAAELAEKARDGGALSPEVASYLRQLGVPLRAH
jgi:MSHA biogenesis protein MshN